jgi:hypothetical protein
MLNDIDAVFSTVDRQENYLEATLASFSEEQPISPSHPVTLVLGSPSTAQLKGYLSHPGVQIVAMGPHTWAWIGKNNLRHRATWNYYRCLTHDHRGKRGSLVFEDDVHFARGWRRRLDASISQLEHDYNEDFVLSIYDPWVHQFPSDSLYAEYQREHFFGTQAMYFPAKTRERFAKYLKRHGVAANEGHYDHILRDYVLKEGLMILASTPSLVQHTGQKTTGLGCWHKAPNFVEDVTDLPIDGLPLDAPCLCP